MAIPRGYTEDREAVTFEIQEGPDERGRYQFEMFWFNGSAWRAQVFHANPGEYLERERGRGKKVVVVKATL